MYILRKNKFLLAYLLWVAGVVLIYASFLSDSEEMWNQLFYNALFVIFLPISFLFMYGKARTYGLIIFSILSIPVMLIETGWFLMDGSTLVRNQFYVIYATNPEEASGLISLLQWWQWLVLTAFFGICIALFILALRENAQLSTESNHPYIGVSLIGFLLLIPGVRYNVPCVNFYNTYRGYYKEKQLAKNFLNSRKDISAEVNCNLPDTATIVVVIGESLNKNHCSLYGYCRPTTPRLDNRDDIVVYRQVTSSSFMTQEVLQQVLTFDVRKNSDSCWISPTLPELLNASGWKTYWFDPYEGKNNTTNTIPSSFSLIARICQIYQTSDDSERYDEAHLNHLNRALQDSTATRKIIFLHLIGNHFPYERRYPEQFMFFEDKDVCSPYLNELNEKQIATINTYDNAVRYNDWLMDSILNTLDSRQECCALLYFSDHGEEVFDLDLYAGRSFNHITQSLYEIPCIFWQNDSFTLVNPLYLDPYVPYCTENMIHTLLDICAISYYQKDENLSLFNTKKE